MKKHLLKCSKCPEFIKRLFLTSQKAQVDKYSEHQEKATSASFAIDSASTSSAPSSFASTSNALQSNARKQRIKPFFDTMDKCKNIST